MKKLLLASVLAIASFPGYAADQRADAGIRDDVPSSASCHAPEDNCDESGKPARVTVAPPYQGPPPIGWVYQPYTVCGDPPRCSMGVVNVDASGLNVRITPDGPPVMALVNGTPLYPVDKRGNWLLVAPACDLTPTWAWSWNVGVPLNRCWVYF
jgi:hypothetical protein